MNLPHANEMHRRALRYSIWIGLLHAQTLGLPEIASQLLTVLVYLDGLVDIEERSVA